MSRDGDGAQRPKKKVLNTLKGALENSSIQQFQIYYLKKANYFPRKNI
jgi:hypothetical protein